MRVTVVDVTGEADETCRHHAALLLLAAPSTFAQTTAAEADIVRRALALGETDPTAARAMLLPFSTRDDLSPGLMHATLAKLAMKQGDSEQADADLRAGLNAIGIGGDDATRHTLLNMRATFAKEAGEDARAAQYAQVATSVARKLDDPDRLRRALVKEGQYLTETLPDLARDRLREARTLADGNADTSAEIDALLAALPSDDVATDDDRVVVGLAWRELIPLGLPLFFAVLMLATARRRRSVLAHYETWSVIGLAARSLIPIYGQANLLGWRRALARHRDGEPLPSMGDSYGTDGVTTSFAIYGPTLVAVVVLMLAFVLDNDVLEAAAAVAMIALLASTLVLEPVLHHVRDMHGVLPVLQPGHVARLLRRHPLQSLELVVVFALNNVVMIIGNMWWIFGGTVATTIGATSQGEAMRRFATRVVERDLQRERAARSGASVGGSSIVVPTFNVDDVSSNEQR